MYISGSSKASFKRSIYHQCTRSLQGSVKTQNSITQEILHQCKTFLLLTKWQRDKYNAGVLPGPLCLAHFLLFFNTFSPNMLFVFSAATWLFPFRQPLSDSYQGLTYCTRRLVNIALWFLVLYDEWLGIVAVEKKNKKERKIVSENLCAIEFCLQTFQHWAALQEDCHSACYAC